MPTKELLSIPEVAESLAVCERTVKKLIGRGDVASVQIGKRRLVPTEAVRDYVDRLVRDAEAACEAVLT